jgi:hypothetical protein
MAQSTPQLIHMRVGRYDIKHLLGRGGMGVEKPFVVSLSNHEHVKMCA